MTRGGVKFLPQIFEANEQVDECVIDLADKNEEVLKSRWSAAIYASFMYSMSQFSKEKRTTTIGFSTIFLIVFIAAFIVVFKQNASSLFYLIALNNAGDTDVLVTSNQRFEILT